MEKGFLKACFSIYVCNNHVFLDFQISQECRVFFYPQGSCRGKIYYNCSSFCSGRDMSRESGQMQNGCKEISAQIKLSSCSLEFGACNIIFTSAKILFRDFKLSTICIFIVFTIIELRCRNWRLLAVQFELSPKLNSLNFPDFKFELFEEHRLTVLKRGESITQETL